MILGSNGQVFATNVSACETQAIEGLRRGHLVDQMQIDVEQVWCTVVTLYDQVVVPELFGKRQWLRNHYQPRFYLVPKFS